MMRDNLGAALAALDTMMVAQGAMLAPACRIEGGEGYLCSWGGRGIVTSRAMTAR